MNFYPSQPSPPRMSLIRLSIPCFRPANILNFKLAAVVLLFVLAVTCSSYAADPFFDDVTYVPHVTNVMNATNMSSKLVSKTNSPAVATTNGMEALDSKYKLAIGDTLSFQILEDGDDPKLIVVTDSGDLEVPYIGRVPAVGKTCKELAGEIKAKLEKTYYYQATVILAVNKKARSLGQVYLVGQVRMPGPQDIPSDEVFTLSKAILRAGGFTDFADQSHVRVTRADDKAAGGKKTFVVDVSQIFDEGKIEDDLTLKSGDLIYIPEQMIRF
jgi:protein involved in polysaccharide export with SLBB domain